MSVFGQVWVYSAAAFVCGAFLSWLFLARGARRRVRDLERELAAHGTAEPARDAGGRGVEGPASRAARSDVDGREDGVTPLPRNFVPTDVDPDTASDGGTRQWAAEPSWPERDSLAGRAAGSGRTDEFDELDAEFASQDAAESGLPPAADRPDEPTRIDGRRGPAPGTPGTGTSSEHVGGPRPDAPRSGGSLFDPAQPGDAPRAERAGTEHTGDRPVPDHTQVLPKREPGKSPLESFGQPRSTPPAPEPSPEPTPEPTPDPGRRGGPTDGAGPAAGGAAPASRSGGGSLFDPTPSGGGKPPARGNPAPSERTPGPFGPGSAMPLPGGERPSADYTVKASVTALRYCDERSPDFPKMVAEVWFRTPEDAERVGFRPLNG